MVKTQTRVLARIEGKLNLLRVSVDDPIDHRFRMLYGGVIRDIEAARADCQREALDDVLKEIERIVAAIDKNKSLQKHLGGPSPTLDLRPLIPELAALLFHVHVLARKKDLLNVGIRLRKESSALLRFFTSTDALSRQMDEFLDKLDGFEQSVLSTDTPDEEVMLVQKYIALSQYMKSMQASFSLLGKTAAIFKGEKEVYDHFQKKKASLIASWNGLVDLCQAVLLQTHSKIRPAEIIRQVPFQSIQTVELRS